MDLSLTAIDVDGSFANPVVQFAVYAWALVLAAALMFAFFWIRSRWPLIVAGVVISAFGCLSSPFANRFIGVVFYRVTSKPGVNVGFIGGPPFWLSTVFAFAITGAIAVVIGRLSAPEAERERPRSDGQND